LRSPLTVLYGSAQFLRNRYDGIDEKLRREMVETLAHECDNMRQLVENLLALARPAANDFLDLVPTDLREALTAAVAAFERASPRRMVEFEAGGEQVVATIEKVNFQRVMQNLLENADKYSPPDQPIEVRLTASGADAFVEVMDHGPGVDATELDLIFASFYRSKTTAAGASGKGLGLAVCRRLLQQMHGSIEARLRSGGGLILRATLPLQDAEAPPTD
ncbi:MAG TPA: ATP-binding protein, partial [Dehalococcoidia bacterium]